MNDVEGLAEEDVLTEVREVAGERSCEQGPQVRVGQQVYGSSLPDMHTLREGINQKNSTF